VILIIYNMYLIITTVNTLITGDIWAHRAGCSYVYIVSPIFVKITHVTLIKHYLLTYLLYAIYYLTNSRTLSQKLQGDKTHAVLLRSAMS